MEFRAHSGDAQGCADGALDRWSARRFLAEFTLSEAEGLGMTGEGLGTTRKPGDECGPGTNQRRVRACSSCENGRDGAYSAGRATTLRKGEPTCVGFRESLS